MLPRCPCGRCRVAGPEDNKNHKCEVFSSETLKEQLGKVSGAKVFEDFSSEV